MLSRNWLHNAAFGGCLGVLLVASVALGQETAPEKHIAQEPPAKAKEAVPSTIVENDNTGPGDSDARAQEKADPPQNQATSAAPPNGPVSTPAADVETEHRDHYPNCEFSDIQECDLAAQQSMADSTDWMNRAAWAGVTLTVLGLFLLWRTMRYTRDAADHTRVAANAARDAVDEAIRTTKIAEASLEEATLNSVRQLRAYTFVYDSKIRTGTSRGMGTVDITVRLKNYGHTPAYRPRHRISTTIRKMPNNKGFPEPEARSMVQIIVAPGGDYVIHFTQIDRVQKDAMDNIRSGNAAIFAWGDLIYYDAFGKERTTPFRFRHSKSGFGGEHDLQICEEGNEPN